MFVVLGNVFLVYEYKVKVFGVFITEQKASDAIQIMVDRFMKEEDLNDEDYEMIENEYRINFQILPVGDLDDDTFFKNSDILCF